MKRIIAIALTIVMAVASMSFLTACVDDSKTIYVLNWGIISTPI